MKWHFLNTGFNTGRFNMDFDMQLAENCGENEAYLRLYRWKPECISLGSGQDENQILKDKAAAEGIDIVVRPTGGRGILHAEELTYSVIYPLDVTSSVRDIYHKINEALALGLSLYDEKLGDTDLEDIQPDFASLYKENMSVCFAVPAKSELKFKGKKLAGSAQRKLKNTLLQHGSILCGTRHRALADYLNISPEAREKVISKIESGTIELETILGRETDYEKLADDITEGFKEYKF